MKALMWEFWWYPESFKVFLEVRSRDAGCQRGWELNPCFGVRSVEVREFIKSGILPGHCCLLGCCVFF